MQGDDEPKDREAGNWDIDLDLWIGSAANSRKVVELGRCHVLMYVTLCM